MGEAKLMDQQILRAKLYVPRGRVDNVPRPRLYERLDDGVRHELTVVSAPAGFGKTTLLADWSRRSERPVAWVSLDERDDDPVRFLSYVIAAIGTIHKDFGETTRAFLSSLQSQEELEPVLTALSNEILELPRDFVLVLDDYHAIRSKTIHDALAFLLEHSPPPMHLVVAGRTRPPLPLSRLRARGRLTELGAPDLRFTLEEATNFLVRTMGLKLTGESVAKLEEGTEGWIAGLQLAAHALRSGEYETRPVEEFAGSARYVFDYLADEVLSHQPEDIREFLLKTSIVETLSAPCAKRSLTLPADDRCWKGWRGPTSSWCRWTKRVATSVIITFSPPSCANACSACTPTLSSTYTAAPSSGTKTTAVWPGRLSTPWQQKTSIGRRA